MKLTASNPNDKSSIQSKVREIVSDQLSIEPGIITARACFVEDLGADSLDVVELVMRFEEEFEVEIPDEDAEKLTTVGSLVAYIREKIGNGDVDYGEPEGPEPVPPLLGGEGEEGQERIRQHKIRERNATMVRAKKKWALETLGHLRCEVCNFDFSEEYGPLGKDYIECHHTIPLAQSVEGRKTRMEDLALVCANCHRMLHRKSDVLSLDDLRRLVAAKRSYD